MPRASPKQRKFYGVDPLIFLREQYFDNAVSNIVTALRVVFQTGYKTIKFTFNGLARVPYKILLSKPFY